jgi:hypothetical protein
MSAALALLAMLIELCVGYPERLTRAIGHPVTWIGRLIEQCDRHLNREIASGLRRIMGTLAIVVLLGVIGAIAFVAQSLLLRLPYGLIALAALASTMVAQRSLHRMSPMSRLRSINVASMPGGRQYRILSAAILPNSTALAWPARRSKASPRISRTRWSLRFFGCWSQDFQASRCTRRSTPPTA